MRRRTTAEQTSDLPRGAIYDEMYGAGCLVTLGLIGLLPLLLIMWVITAESLQSAWNAFVWTGPAEFLQSVWRWMRRGSPDTRIVSVFSIFAFGYCALLWQWIVFVVGGRTLLSPSRLWAVSSVYFMAMIAGILRAIYSGPTTSEQSQDGLALACCVIPSVFLAVTLPLWLLKPRLFHESTKPR